MKMAQAKSLSLFSPGSDLANLILDQSKTYLSPTEGVDSRLDLELPLCSL